MENSQPQNIRAATLTFNRDQFFKHHILEAKIQNQIKSLTNQLSHVASQKENFYRKFRGELIECISLKS